MARRKLSALRSAKLRALTGKTTSPTTLDLLDFIPAINPRYERPDHLAPIAELFERAEREPVRALVSVAPQHGKTDTILAGLARHIARRPWLRNGYATYGDRLARKKSRQCRDIALAAGVQLRDDAQAVNDWMTVEGGGLLATSSHGALTGNPIDGILVIDDPHKDRADAESALSRENIWDWYNSTAKVRCHPTASILVVHTRWHEDDMIGRLSKERTADERKVWEEINLAAIRDDGQPLWHRRPLSFLEEQKRGGEYDWWSLWMGSPRPRGSSVFRGVKFYDQLPVRYRIGKGVDLAYTAKTRADWSVGIVILREDRLGEEPLFYVVDVRRAQAEVPEFVSELEAASVSWPGAWHWFCSTTEKGVAQVVSRDDIHIEPVLATADKFVRAQSLSQAWNEGRVLVPRQAPWLKSLVDEIGAFSGVGDRRDDQVDALVSAFECVRFTSDKPRNVPGAGSRYSSDRGFG
jgi:predicted phage terminase large subunit-like protein